VQCRMDGINMLSIVMLVGITVIGFTPITFAQQGEEYSTVLSGSEEVPPTESNATGIAEITTLEENSTGVVYYTVNASNIADVTAGHIHLGKQGENGPVAATLFKYDFPRNEVAASGYITADKLEGPMSGQQISDLITAITNGETYANIHTEKHPNGEIRGQIR
jgi:hypothetical protein